MGFKREAKVFKLVFEGEFEGLEVRTRSVSLGRYLQMQDLINGDLDREGVAKLFEAFVGIILSWNLEDEADQPVPVSVEALYDQDLDFVKAVSEAWSSAMAGVAAPLEPSSSDGEPSPEASIPMEPLPASQAS